MGQLIILADRIAARRGADSPGMSAAPAAERDAATGRAAFYFAFDCPVAYLLAERVERDLGEIAWTPLLSPVPARPWSQEPPERALREAGRLRLPLLEPENHPGDVRPMTRAAVYAAGQGAAARFSLAALRLAFAGGYALADPEAIAAVAASADLDPDAVLAASRAADADAGLAQAARSLHRLGIVRGPALRIAGIWFTGLDALGQSSDFTAARASYRRRAAEPA